MPANEYFKGLDSLIPNDLSLDQDELEASFKEGSAEPEKKDEKKEEGKEEKAVAFTLDELEKEFAATPDKDGEAEKKAKETTDEKEEGAEKKEDAAENAEPDDASTSIYKTVSEFFKEEGLIESEFSDKDSFLDTFKGIIKKETTDGIEDYKGKLPVEIKTLIENYEEGVPLMDLLELRSEQISLASIDEAKLKEDVELQKDLLEVYYKETTKFSDEKIKKEIKKAEDLSELEELSKDALKELKEIKTTQEAELKEKSKKEREAAIENNKLLLKKVDETIKSTKEIIPGKKISEKEQKELYDYLTKPVEVRDNTPITLAMKKREEDRIGFDIKLNYFIKQGFFDNKFEEFVKKAETNVSSKLEKQLEEALKAKQNKSGASAEPTSKNKSEEIVKAYTGLRRG